MKARRMVGHDERERERGGEGDVRTSCAALHCTQYTTSKVKTRARYAHNSHA